MIDQAPLPAQPTAQEQHTVQDRPIPGPPDPARRRFLPEVQALRAVAVLAVVCYHLRPDLLPGGFIGVDVFFVISGFLITGHMVREVEQHGRLRLGHFWANRARRILPAALLLIALVVATATLIVPVTEWSNLGRQAVASVFYVQNWLLAGEAVDYSASDNAATPFQHFWSLAVEEQFYLFWPLLAVLAAWLSRRAASRWLRQSTGLRIWLLGLFGVVVIVSFGWNMIMVGREDQAAYFVTTTRIWELGVGGLLAVALRRTDGRRWLRTGLASAGAAMIIIGLFTLSATTPFPGVAGLLPVLGATAVIAAGRTVGPGSLTRLVELAPVQWLGNISYSLYLWHFPIVVYFTTRAGRSPSTLEALGLLVPMLIGSTASYYLVEQPIRTAGWARRSDPRALFAAGTAMAVIAASCAVFWIRPLQQERTWDVAASTARHDGGSSDHFGAGTPRSGHYRAFIGGDRVMAPSPARAKPGDQFLDGDGGRCEAKRDDDLARRCDYGNPQSGTRVAVVGDSHARMYLPAVLRTAEQRGWQVITFIKNSCPYSQTARIFPDAKSCLVSNRGTARRLIALHPDVIVTAAYAGSRFVDDGRKWHGTAGFAASWRDLHAEHIPVVVLQDAPQPRTDVVACVSQHYTRPSACAVRRGNAVRQHGIVAAAARGVAGVAVVDLTDRFCTTRRCPPVIGDVLVYIDGNHLSRTYATTLAPDIAPALTAAVGH